MIIQLFFCRRKLAAEDAREYTTLHKYLNNNLSDKAEFQVTSFLNSLSFFMVQKVRLYACP